MARESGSVRVGPVSIFSLIIILCLSVMAVLTVTTSNASVYEAHKQADYTIGTYAAEAKAQEFVADVDGILALTAASGGDLADAATVLEEQLPPETSVELVDDDTLEASLAFMATDGRTLTVVVTVDPSLKYQITSWKLTTNWNPESAGQLWTGQ